jgi:hypothetical protein
VYSHLMSNIAGTKHHGAQKPTLTRVDITTPLSP